MRRLSGFVFDTYDDAGGQVLRSVINDPSDIPPFVKTASRLTPSQIDALPDDKFALVLLDEGYKLKKYAMVDEGNTTLSVLYLLKQAHLLPPAAVKTAAHNLMAACQHYGLEIPQQLKMAAMTGMSPVSGKSQHPYMRGAKVNHINFPVPSGPKESADNPTLGNHDAAWDDVSGRTNAAGSPGSNFMELPLFPQKEKVKTAAPAGAEVIVKQKSWFESPYYDASGWDPMSTEPEPALPERTLLGDNYPADSWAQVKTASIYFKENVRDFAPRDRHEYCVKLASRMDELGMDVPPEVERYGSTTYASDVEAYVEARRSYVLEEHHPALDLLLEKRAQVGPTAFAEALAEFDKATNLNWHWGAQIADPWYSTFGPSLEKVAAADWRYDDCGTRINERDLERLARNGHERLTKSFGADFAKEFAKSPKAVFESLPTPNKLILARLASDQHNGTYTE